MWDEEINKKIKDAADQYHPAYDDTAWNKMKQMLDEHLPRKKERRRIIYFLPLILLLTGGLFFVMFYKETGRTSQNSAQKLGKNIPTSSPNSPAKVSSHRDVPVPGVVKPIEVPVANAKAGNELQKQPSPDAASPGLKKVPITSTPGNLAISNKNSPAPETVPGNRRRQNKNKKDKVMPVEENSTAANYKAGDTETIPQTAKSSNEPGLSPAATGDNNAAKEVNPPVTNVTTSATQDEKETLKSTDVTKTAQLKEANSTSKEKKAKKTAIQNWALGLSVGPDVSGVGLGNTGKVTLTYGAQLSYSITDKFTLHTGFYVAKKIYSADDADYYVPPGSTWNNFLQSIGANCKVYEIPLTVSYNFGKYKNHSWFAATGLSSYFMKRESYIYYYKNSSGVTYNRPWSVENKNKHYFSVLDISAGYQYAVNRRLSITGEPYLKLPLSGIGAGKIKLNSAGVLFTVMVKPF